MYGGHRHRRHNSKLALALIAEGGIVGQAQIRNIANPTIDAVTNGLKV